MEVQENYDAAVGFTRRTGFRKINPRVTFAPRPRQHPWIRRFNFGGDVDWFLDPRDNKPLTREIDMTAFQVDLHTQDSIQFHVVPTYELLEEDFGIAPGMTLPVGQRVQLHALPSPGKHDQSPPARSLARRWNGASFYSGDRLRLSLTANLRAAPGQMFTFTNEWNRVSLAEGQFYTRLYRVIAETQFNPRVVTRQQRAVRLAERRHRLAIAVPVDRQPRATISISSTSTTGWTIPWRTGPTRSTGGCR